MLKLLKNRLVSYLTTSYLLFSAYPFFVSPTFYWLGMLRGMKRPFISSSPLQFASDLGSSSHGLMKNECRVPLHFLVHELRHFPQCITRRSGFMVRPCHIFISDRDMLQYQTGTIINDIRHDEVDI